MLTALVVLVALPLAVVACDKIIGLDKYCSTDCDASVVDSGLDADSDAPVTDAGLDINIPDVVDEATSWARWRMENPVQEVEAGAPVLSQAQFIPLADAGTNEVFDNVTKLHWSTTSGAASTIDDAAKFCATQLQPLNTWRLPTRIEAVSLIDTTQKTAPFIAQTFAPTVSGQFFLWTASYLRPINTSLGLEFWFIQLNTGDVTTSVPGSAGVLCVR